MTALSQTARADSDRVLDIQSYKTDAGLEFWHVEDHSLPIITMHFAFDGAGSVNDPQGKAGVAQLLSNTLDEGAGDRDAQAFQEALDDHAIELSFSSNRDYFSGKMKTLKRHSDLAFELLHDAVTSPRLDDEAIDRMRQANIARIKSSVAKPNWQASRIMNEVLFGEHPYAKNSGGTLSGLEGISADDLRSFAKKYLTRNRLKIAMAGDITAEEAGKIIDKIFADISQGDDRVSDANDVTYPSETKSMAFQTQSPQSVVQMVWPSLSKNDPDYHTYRVLNHILGGGGFSSMLMDEIREKQGLTYGIYSQPIFMAHANYIVIESAMSPENIAPMMKSIEEIVLRLKQDDVAEDVLKDAKSYLIGSLPLRFSSTLSLSGAALRMQLDGRSITALDEWANAIEAVTSDDIVRVANRIFVQNDPIVTIVAGAVPDGGDYEMIDTLPGVE